MRLTIILAASLLLAASAMPHLHGDGHASAEAQIRQLQAQLIQGYMHNDAALLNRLLADDYTFIDESGRYLTKPHIVASFRGGDHHVFSYQMSEERVRVYGDAAVMTYRYVANENYKGQNESGDYRVTRLFAKKNGGWQIVAGQETRIAPSR